MSAAGEVGLSASLSRNSNCYGADRAEYGGNLLAELSARLRTRRVSDTGRRSLDNDLTFYRAHPEIVRTVTAQSTEKNVARAAPGPYAEINNGSVCCYECLGRAP
jgi:hypothetical protein